jgi:hypothetical protein
MANVEASLPLFEQFVIKRNREQSLLTALAILESIEDRYGQIDHIFDKADSGLKGDEAVEAFCTRFATAFGRMITAPNFSFLGSEYSRLLQQHHWLEIIFALSRFRGPQHLFPLIATKTRGGGWRFKDSGLLRFLAIRPLSSRLDLDFDQLWRTNTNAAAIALLNYIGSRSVLSSRGLQLRERLLEWLPSRLDEVRLGALTLSKTHDTYMHCSYAFTPRKHAIKAGLIRQMRRVCLEAGCKEFSPGSGMTPGSRPTVIVVLERFGRNHSVYRTHWLALRSLRERFNVVWVAYQGQIDSGFQADFDELIPIPEGHLFNGVCALADEILRRAPALVFHVGVGMSAAVIALASLRLAPIQCVSFGHTATTMSPTIDYMILPEDFIGASECFSEKLIALPRHAMPFMPPQIRLAPADPNLRTGPVRVAVAASVMKLNDRLFKVLKRIAAATKSPVEFQFLPAFAVGLMYHELTRVIRGYLPNAVVHPQSAYPVYLDRLARCDLFLCPFPYGNMNSIVDAVGVGLPGVCLDGPEAHAHADAAIFARIGFPQTLAAQTIDEYVAIAACLIDDAGWRAECRQIAMTCDLDRSFFEGDASLFCGAIADLIWPASEMRQGALSEST